MPCSYADRRAEGAPHTPSVLLKPAHARAPDTTDFGAVVLVRSGRCCGTAAGTVKTDLTRVRPARTSLRCLRRPS
jgi:hypothetical protein